jgi:hypothetical protein
VRPADPPLVHPLRDLFDAAVRGYTIKLTCLGCSHVRIFDAHALWWHFHRRGWNDRFPHVTRRAVCTNCLATSGRKTRQPKLELVRDDPTGEDLPMPPIQEWKAVLRRVR